ncbi:MAG TPA: hypothetical protein VN376_02540, partial [Longilinea sp.]|nr:hypothetical protein [Longilinea sp.]
MSLDISSTISVVTILLIILAVYWLLNGYTSIRTGAKLFYYRKRKDMINTGWGKILAAFFIGIVAVFLSQLGGPV